MPKVAYTIAFFGMGGIKPYRYWRVVWGPLANRVQGNHINRKVIGFMCIRKPYINDKFSLPNALRSRLPRIVVFSLNSRCITTYDVHYTVFNCYLHIPYVSIRVWVVNRCMCVDMYTWKSRTCVCMLIIFKNLECSPASRNVSNIVISSGLVSSSRCPWNNKLSYRYYKRYTHNTYIDICCVIMDRFDIDWLRTKSSHAGRRRPNGSIRLGLSTENPDHRIHLSSLCSFSHTHIHTCPHLNIWSSLLSPINYAGVDLGRSANNRDNS